MNRTKAYHVLYQMLPLILGIAAALFIWMRLQKGFIIGGDSRSYLDLARSYVQGNIPHTEIWQPGYPFLIAILARVFQTDILNATQWLHIILFGLNAFLFVRLLRKADIANPVLQFFFTIVFISFAHYRIASISYMAELPFITMLLLALQQLPKLQNEITTKRLLLFAITLLGMYFIKPNGIAIAITACIWILLLPVSLDIKWKYTSILAFVFALGVFALNLLFGGFHGLQTPENSGRSFFHNLYTEMGNIGAVFNCFILNSNIFFQVHFIHFIWTLAYFTLLFYFFYVIIKNRKNFISRSVFTFSVIAIPVYVLIYIAATSISYPQVNPRTMLFPNILLLFCCMDQASRLGLKHHLGKLLYAILIGFFVFGIQNFMVSRTLMKLENETAFIQNNKALNYVNQYLVKHPDVQVYTNHPKEAALFLHTPKVLETPGVPVWHGNKKIPITPDSLNKQWQYFGNSWCDQKNSIILILHTHDDEHEIVSFPCSPKIIRFDDGEVWMHSKPQ